MNYFKQFKGLPKQVYILCLARLIIGIGSMGFSVITLMFRDVIGFSEFETGLILFGTCWSNVLGSIVGGHLADKIGRKKIVIITSITNTVGYICSALLCRTKFMVIVAMVNNFLGAAGYPTISAMVSDAMPEGRETESFSLLYLAMNVGTAIGPAIGGMLFYNHLELIFVLEAVFMVISACFIGFFATDNYDPKAAREEAIRRYEESVAAGKEEGKEESLWSVLNRERMLLYFIIALVVITIFYQMVSFIFSMQLSDEFGLQIGSRYSGFLWTVNGATVVVATPILVNFTKKRHQYVNTCIGLLFYMVGFGSYAFIKSPNMFLVMVVVWTLGEIMLSTGAGAFISEHSPASHVARCQSLYEMARFAGRGFGPPLFGVMLKFLNYKQSWILNAVSCVCISVILFLIWKKDGSKAH